MIWSEERQQYVFDEREEKHFLNTVRLFLFLVVPLVLFHAGLMIYLAVQQVTHG